MRGIRSAGKWKILKVVPGRSTANAGRLRAVARRRTYLIGLYTVYSIGLTDPMEHLLTRRAALRLTPALLPARSGRGQAKIFEVRDYVAKGDAVTLDTSA